MVYSILNYFLDKKINKLRSFVSKALARDLAEQEEGLNKIASKDVVTELIYSGDTSRVNSQMEVLSRRIEMDRKYILLLDRFRNDPKRKFMIRKNFHAYLGALKFLYQTSETSVASGILMAPPNIYHIIDEVEKSFDGFFERV